MALFKNMRAAFCAKRKTLNIAFGLLQVIANRRRNTDIVFSLKAG
jgi:hypothetical protein